MVRSYQLIKAARMSDEQRRWALTPVRNDLPKYIDIAQSATKTPEGMAKTAHLVRYDEDGKGDSRQEPSAATDTAAWRVLSGMEDGYFLSRRIAATEDWEEQQQK